MRMIDADVLERKLMVMPDEELCEDCCYNVVNAISEMPTVGGWISVKDKLPDAKLKREKWVLVSLVNNNNGHRRETPVVAKYVTRHKEWFFAGCDIDDVTVTHWTHLPVAPEEVSGDA